MSIKTVKLLFGNMKDEITERKTIYNSKTVWYIDTSVLRKDKIIVLFDENNIKISEIFVPSNMLVIVDYITE